jgi:catechol 2,3-dioxygenase-like lactoylglutathione lyase family enzyme
MIAHACRIPQRWQALAALAILVGLPLNAQERRPPNAAGVTMGHLHFHVRDVAANARFWASLGGVVSGGTGSQTVSVGGALIELSQGTPTGTSDGAVVNHVAFRVPSLAALEASGLTLAHAGPDLPGIATVMTPEGERIELFDNSATNTWFRRDGDGSSDADAQRSVRPTTAPITLHHIHLLLPDEAAIAAAKTWYATIFGGTPGVRWHYQAVDLPGLDVNFGVATKPVRPTKGRMLDHIGFEVKSLAAFCKRLESMGVSFDRAYTATADGVGEAALTDPWGTSIELTEGPRTR